MFNLSNKIDTHQLQTPKAIIYSLISKTTCISYVSLVTHSAMTYHPHTHSVAIETGGYTIPTPKIINPKQYAFMDVIK